MPGPSRKPYPAADPSPLAKQQPQVVALLDKLDSVDDSKFRNRRSTTRVSYRRLNVQVHVHHPGGSASVRGVATRNLSASGIGFLYPSFLHVGTRAEVLLERQFGGTDLLRGQVVFCAHVGGVHHQIGVRFDAKIFPKLYADPVTVDRADAAARAPAAAAGDAVPASNVLLIDDQPMDRVLMGHHLRETSATLTAVPDERAALKAMQGTRFDIVFCDLNLETSTGDATITLIRRSGYRGPICLITAERAPSRLAAAIRAGAHAILHKPYDRSALLALLGGARTEVRDVAVGDAVETTLPLTPQTEAIVGRYVNEVHEAAAKLEAAVQGARLDVARQLCSSLRGSGTTFGFGGIHEAAREAMRVLEATNSIDECATQVRALADLCRRAVLRK